MESIKINTAQNIALEYQKAGIGDRVVSHFIDSVILLNFYVLTFSIMSEVASREMHQALLILFSFVPISFYHLLCEIFMNGQSIGKKMMNIRVVKIDGTPADIGVYTVRWLTRVVDTLLTLGVGAILALVLWDKNQRLGDYAAKSTVVKISTTEVNAELLSYTPVKNSTVKYPKVAYLKEEEIQLLRQALQIADEENNAKLLAGAANHMKKVLGIEVPVRSSEGFIRDILNDYYLLQSTHN